MDDEYSDNLNLEIFDYPVESEQFTSFDPSNGEDYTCISHFAREDGVVVFQDFEFYDIEGNRVCR